MLDSGTHTEARVQERANEKGSKAWAELERTTGAWVAGLLTAETRKS